MAKPSPKTSTKRAASRGRGKRKSVQAPAPDIVERERALQESEERFRATFEHTAVGVAHTTIEGAFLQVNSRLCQMLGYDLAEFGLDAGQLAERFSGYVDRYGLTPELG